MARQRKPHNGSSSQEIPLGRATNKPRHKPQQYYPLDDSDNEALDNKKQSWLSTSLCMTLASSVILGVAYFLYLGYLETRVNTPLSAPKVVTKTGLDVPDRYWGTYRPGVYFGTRVRHPTSPVTGLMWFLPGHFQQKMLAVRHWCDQADELSSYGWQRHDGRYFGSQVIQDKGMTITTDFVKRLGGKHGGDWTARITAHPKTNAGIGQLASLLYYVALDPDDPSGSIQPLVGSTQGPGALMGSAEALGTFRLHLLNSSGVVRHTSYLSTRHLGLDLLKETVFRSLRPIQSPGTKEKYIGFPGEHFPADSSSHNANYVAFQVTAELPFQIEVVFESDSFSQRPNMLMGDVFSRDLKKYSEEFDAQFDHKFPLKEKGFTEDEIAFAKAAMSNMIGGIGYFYGASRVQGRTNNEPVPYWKAPLYTGVPSRSFFPRGFLWDEGFHNLLISKWDKEISLDIVAHWMDLMNWDGWIPREQILGSEARARVPEEFVVQRSENANPPTLLLTLHSMMNVFKEGLSDDDYDSLKLLWPRLRLWYSWFNTTQSGPVPGSYRWRGRDASNKRELNPKTLTSGLDDYPRASHPSVDERHLDLRCWMTMASGLMADIATMIEKDPARYQETYDYLRDNDLLDRLHWSSAEEGYMDYGLHTFDVSLQRKNPGTEMQRVTYSTPKLRFVDSPGYVSFFPLFLQILEPYSLKLGKVLEDLKRPDLLWTNYGLRSLARKSPLYMKRNTEHDPPYWRGPIWVNMNYLCIRALYYYANTPGPYSDLALEIYKTLRQNLIKNIIKEYKRSGYIWEQYNDQTGKGQGCRPFTGWSALVVLIMAENY
ncbi:hypothetical protein HAZT_HAZT002463 [Hyalella azteca]|uniref:Mannosyl-oligosaccharide glucosidase n=1 Tax=Hyalella azteca TaxID=294128 RepID=A0A6A0H994_HYAAZ|nr:mannosyl-oligosaccharide glucosidase-like [Hyalella azteca]KAA0202272.1 hypothetical protein HAZT_HAZT002463 [Hyalella azteca]